MRSAFDISRSCYSAAASALFLMAIGCTPPAAHIEAPPPSLSDEVASFKPVEPEEWSLPNGMTVMFLQDNELPMVKGRLFIRGGSLWGPQSPTGVVGAMGELMRLGGAGQRKADALDLELERLAANVSTNFGAEFGGGGFACLSSDFEHVFSIFSDVILKPRFDGDRVALWKGQAMEGIRRRIEDPSTVTSLSFTQIVYGGTPYGRISTERDVAAINREQLTKLHSSFVRPDGAILAISGRVDREVVRRLVEDRFGGWTARGALLPPAPPIPAEPEPGIYFVTLPFQQATIEAGQLGVPRLTPDYPAIDVFNEVFGSGGFGSRLMKRVRTELGLSYGIYGGIAPGVVRGVNFLFLQTKSGSVGQALSESISVLRQLQKEAPTEAELDEKKAGIRNSFVFNFDSPEDIIARRARLALLRYPPDYDQTYIDKIDAVTPKEVQRVAEDRWQPAKFVIVVVGNESAYSDLQAKVASDPALQGVSIKKLRFGDALIMGDSVSRPEEK